MKRYLIVALAVIALLFACDSGSSNDDDDSGDIGIEGSWTLTTVQDAAASSAGCSGTLNVVGSAYTLTLTNPLFGTGTETGTVISISPASYIFTPAGGGDPCVYTVSDAGAKLSNTTNPSIGEHSFTRD